MKHEELIKRLEVSCLGLDPIDPLRLLVDDVVAALAQPEQEPVAWETVYETIIHWDEGGGKRSRRELAQRIIDLYTAPPAQPPQRTWVGLTGEDVVKAYDDYQSGRFSAGFMGAIRSIEAKLKQKNGFAEEKNAICSPFMISELWRLQK